ncbi:MAG: hypothetical protein GTO14_23875 [Anaerolineales bacterium]|nr:hypothetical protein [Anaerolineales bacterium]
MTLLAVGLVAAHLVLERRNKLNRIENLVIEGTERVIRSLEGVDIERFANLRECYEYLEESVLNAESTIDDLTFGFKEPLITPDAQRAHDKYLEAIASATSRREKTISYREVMSFPALDHISKAESLLSQDLPGYRLRFYEFTQTNLPALLSFMVVDSREVILGFYRAPYLPSEREITMAIRHPDIVQLFQDYYDSIWLGAKVLKEGDRSERAMLKEIEQRVNRMLEGT